MTRPLTVEAHYGLAVSIAKKYARVCTHLALEDLVQEALLGLMRGIERFDPSRGVAASTYLTHWIRHHVRRAVTNQDRTVRLPVHFAERLHRRGDLKRERAVALDAPFTEDGGCLHDVLADEAETPEEIADRTSRERLARAALELLDDRERGILEARYLEGRTLKEVGDAQPIAISRERVRQIECEVLLTLREILQPPPP